MKITTARTQASLVK
uniref:Uncharacterized protein n=1 Tax=Arundo donax TaxID=35708 RepID=A0A0A9BYG0_ARUDO